MVADAPVLEDAPVDPEQLVPLGRRTLAQIREELGDCRAASSTRRGGAIVFGVGAEDTPLMFVGEAPGEQEDRRGEPFVGPAGELLDKMIEAMGWTRQTVYIANTIEVPPAGQPQPAARRARAVHAVPRRADRARSRRGSSSRSAGRPRTTLLGNDAPISTLRGTVPRSRTACKVMPTFHPAYLLRDPDTKKRDAWSDLKLVMAELERLGITPPNPPRG